MNKRKLDVVAITTPENESMVIICKDSPMNPSKNVTKLLQSTGAYATTTIDKET